MKKASSWMHVAASQPQSNTIYVFGGGTPPIANAARVAKQQKRKEKEKDLSDGGSAPDEAIKKEQHVCSNEFWSYTRPDMTSTDMHPPDHNWHSIATNHGMVGNAACFILLLSCC